MADYYPLIQRAVSGLDNNTGENRRALYDRARSALVAQLRGVDPPLNESDITRERLALEEAIRKIEGEATTRRKPEAADEMPSLRDEGLRGFRDSVAEAEGLGAAAEEANRSAHGLQQELQQASEDAHARAADHPEPAEAIAEPAELEGEPPPDREWQRSTAPYEEEDYAGPRRSYGGLIKVVVLILIIAGIAGAGYWKRNTLTTWVASLRGTHAPVPREAAPAGRPKIADRIGPSGAAPSSANAPAAAVAQKVVLYDEVPDDPNGKRYVGSAIWRSETVSPGPGLAPELAIRADIEIPERKMRMTWSLRRNTDKALPASHTIEIMFTLPADFSDGGVNNVPGVLMKESETTQRGTPLAGLAVKVTNGYFLIGLSAVEVDTQRNIELLKDRKWFDIPIVYTSGKRAIMSFEKGAPGERVFEEAFRAWGE